VVASSYDSPRASNSSTAEPRRASIAAGIPARRIDARELAQGDRLLDTVPARLGEREPARQTRVRLVVTREQTLRDADADLELHDQIAARREHARLGERGLEDRQRARAIAAIEFEFGEVLAREFGLARGADALSEGGRLAIARLGLVEAALAACEQSERELGARLARTVRHVARDAQRLLEVRLGRGPLPESITDEPEVLMMSAHAREQSVARIDLERLLEISDRLAPLTQVLVHEPEVVERTHETIRQVDAAERRGRTLQPFDRRGRLAGARERVAHRQRDPCDEHMLIRVAQDGVRPARVAKRPPRRTALDLEDGEARGHLRAELRIAQRTRERVRRMRHRESVGGSPAQHLDARDAQHQAHAIAHRVARLLGERSVIRLDRAREGIGGQMQVAQGLMRRVTVEAATRDAGIRSVGGGHAFEPSEVHRPRESGRRPRSRASGTEAMGGRIRVRADGAVPAARAAPGRSRTWSRRRNSW
jgi:hypothetical protein